MVSSENNTYADILEMLSEGGLARMGEAIQILLNHAMAAEREAYLDAERHERTPSRKGYANGYKPKKVKTRVGELELKVPQTRDSKFYPNALEKGIRSERALRIAVAEMYIQGVSTRKVAPILESIGGFGITSTSVSNATAELDELLESWRNRPLADYAYVYLDARYEKVREGGTVMDNGVLIATGVTPAGAREVLGVSVELSEAEVHWRKFLLSLHSRGLHGLKLIISDSHSGLKAALRTVFPTVKWQRCQFHLQQNASEYVPKLDMKAKVAEDIRAVFDAVDRVEADRQLAIAVEKYRKPAPKLSSWMEENLPYGLTVFEFPITHRKKLRTTNPLERLNREIKRRTRVISIFPNAASCLRLVTALLMEQSEAWLHRETPFLHMHEG